MAVGVLAVQGCVEPHCKMLEKLGVTAVQVRSQTQLASVDRLILPGGESTTMLRLMRSSGLWQGVQEFGKIYPVWGICAGAIIIAKEVTNPQQDSLGLIALRARRNFYGSQRESFKTTLSIPCLPIPCLPIPRLPPLLEVDFIRAPLLESLLRPLDDSIEVLAQHAGTGVLFRSGHVLASAFHTELGTDPALHRFFCGL